MPTLQLWYYKLLKCIPIVYLSVQEMSKAIVLAGSLLSVGSYWLYQTVKNNNRFKQEKAIEQQNVEEIIRDIYVRVSTKQNMAAVYDMCRLECANQDDILRPYQYTLKTGGKRIRLIMAVVVSEMFLGKVKEGECIRKEVLLVGGLIELLHSASLIIDDIEDGSRERRGQPCSHLVHGLDSSINAANLMYFLPFRKLYEEVSDVKKRVKLLQIFMEEMTISHMGQAQDIQVHKIKSAQDLPTFEQYESLTIAKTGSLLRMMVKMLCVVLDRPEKEANELAWIMDYVGLAFQVTDDVLNLTNNLGKGQLAEDLREKKFTLIIYHMRNDHEFMDRFIKDQKTEADIHWMLERIRLSQALSFAKAQATIYQETAQSLISNLKTPHSKGRFKKLMMFIITRQN